MKDRYIEISEKFLAMESRLSGKNLRFLGFNVWELVRVRVGKDINRQILNLAPEFSSAKKEKSTYQDFWVHFGNFKNNLRVLVRKQPLLIIGHGRRKFFEGLWWDIYVDPLLDHTKKFTNLIEPPFKGSHFEPAKNAPIGKLDDSVNLLFRYLAAFLVKSLFLFNQRKILPVLDEWQNCIDKTFGIEINFIKIFRRTFISICTQYLVAKFWIFFLKPKMLGLVVSYGKEGWIKAANEAFLPTFELQHGLLTKQHLGYHFPETAKTLFPDYFLSFGHEWNLGAKIPIRGIECIVETGNPWLHFWKERNIKTATAPIVTIISQGTIGPKLAEFIVNTKILFDQSQTESSVRFIYKLHPGEIEQWEKNYSHLKDYGVEVISDNTASLETLLVNSQVTIGVYSTALLEAIDFGSLVGIANVHGYEMWSSLFESGRMQFLSTPEMAAEWIIKSLSHKRESGSSNGDVSPAQKQATFIKKLLD